MYAWHILGSQISLKAIFLSKIWNMNVPLSWVKIYSYCKFLGFSSAILQNKFLAIKFMTKIGQHKTSGNYFQKVKSLESGECWPKLYKTMLNWKLRMLTHLSLKIVTHIFG